MSMALPGSLPPGYALRAECILPGQAPDRVSMALHLYLPRLTVYPADPQHHGRCADRESMMPNDYDEEAMETLVEDLVDPIDEAASDMTLDEAAEFYEMLATRMASNARATRDDIKRRDA